MNRPVKVLQIAATDITVAKILLPLIDRQRADGYEVEIACTHEKYAQDLLKNGYIVHQIPFSRKIVSIKHLIAFLALLRLIWKEEYDIVHVHTPIASMLGRIASKIARTPIVIYTVHGFYFHEHMNTGLKKSLIFIEKLMGRCFTDALFVVSGEDYEIAIKNAIKNKEQTLLLNSIGVNVEKFSDVRLDKDIKHELGIDKDDLLVGFIGRIVREKGLIELALAMRQVVERIPSARLIIIGDTLNSDRDSATKSKIISIIQENKLGGNVTLTGFREDIPELLSVLNLFVLPSYREGMPVTILEAMASGLPVVATNIRGSREEVVDGVTGSLVPVRDVDALAKSITEILLDPEKARKLGDLGRKRVLENFNEEKILNKQADFYKKIVQERLVDS